MDQIDTRGELVSRFNLTRGRLSLFVLTFSLLSIFGQGLLILIFLRQLPPQIPLFYSKPWGEEILARPLFLWILPIIASVSTITNFFVASLGLRENLFLYRILLIFSFLVAFATFLGVAKIIFLLI